MASTIAVHDPRTLWGGDRGAVLVEMTVVIPLLLLIGLGVFEFGNLFYQYHLMENAVRDAARYASGRSDDVCSSSTAQTDIKNVALLTGAGQIWPTGTKITVTCSVGVDNSNQYYRGPATVRSVTVTAQAPYSSLGFLGFFNLASPTLTVSHQERIIGGR